MLAEIFKNMYELRAKKCRLRERYINIRRSLPSDMKKERDNKICSFLLSLASYRYSDVILMYFPCKDEVDIKSVIIQALNDGKKGCPSKMPQGRPKHAVLFYQFT